MNPRTLMWAVGILTLRLGILMHGGLCWVQRNLDFNNTHTASHSPNERPKDSENVQILSGREGKFGELYKAFSGCSGLPWTSLQRPLPQGCILPDPPELCLQHACPDTESLGHQQAVRWERSGSAFLELMSRMYKALKKSLSLSTNVPYKQQALDQIYF